MLGGSRRSTARDCGSDQMDALERISLTEDAPLPYAAPIVRYAQLGPTWKILYGAGPHLAP